MENRLKRVQISAITVKVLPNPISSARIAPRPLNCLIPITHSYKNRTPSFWCIRKCLVRIGSKTMEIGAIPLGTEGGGGSTIASGAFGSWRGSLDFGFVNVVWKWGIVAVEAGGANIERDWEVIGFVFVDINGLPDKYSSFGRMESISTSLLPIFRKSPMDGAGVVQCFDPILEINVDS